jgi:hypothetical protein
LISIKKEWTEHEIDAFTEALHKFKNDWRQIAEYVHRSEQSCRAFYQKHRKKNGLIDDIDEDNASRSGSEDTSHRLIKSRENQQIDEGKILKKIQRLFLYLILFQKIMMMIHKKQLLMKIVMNQFMGWLLMKLMNKYQ